MFLDVTGEFREEFLDDSRYFEDEGEDDRSVLRGLWLARLPSSTIEGRNLLGPFAFIGIL